jgi:hypothetical protein
MATEVNLIDLEEALLVNGERKPQLRESILAALITGVCAAIVTSFFVGRVGVILLAALAMPFGFVSAHRSKRFELRVTRMELTSSGRVGDNFELARSVSMSEVRWLEFQNDTTGPETANHPQGLYAVLGRGSVCLLPEVDERQVASIIERIEGRFPAFRDQWHRDSDFGKHFTSLRLNDPG